VAGVAEQLLARVFQYRTEDPLLAARVLQTVDACWRFFKLRPDSLPLLLEKAGPAGSAFLTDLLTIAVFCL
jgi:hypothetical protein